MRLICEQPWFSATIGMLARKDGKYDRPIVGDIIDLRIEDIIPAKVMQQLSIPSIIAKLPNIPALNQVDRYIVANYGSVDTVTATEKDVQPLLAGGQYVLLPDNPKAYLWAYTLSPWWEYAMVLDSNGAYIKAPKKNRESEPSPEEVDERLDNYPENRDTFRVTSPTVLDKLIAASNKSYQSRLGNLLGGAHG